MQRHNVLRPPVFGKKTQHPVNLTRRLDVNERLYTKETRLAPCRISSITVVTCPACPHAGGRNEQTLQIQEDQPSGTHPVIKTDEGELFCF